MISGRTEHQEQLKQHFKPKVKRQNLTPKVPSGKLVIKRKNIHLVDKDSVKRQLITINIKESPQKKLLISKKSIIFNKARSVVRSDAQKKRLMGKPETLNEKLNKKQLFDHINVNILKNSPNMK